MVSIVSYSRPFLMIIAAFNQEKALVGAFSVITNLRMELFEALVVIPSTQPATNFASL